MIPLFNASSSPLLVNSMYNDSSVLGNDIEKYNLFLLWEILYVNTVVYHSHTIKRLDQIKYVKLIVVECVRIRIKLTRGDEKYQNVGV